MTSSENNMSTSEIITIIKAINDDAINNYCESIVGYFNQKSNKQQFLARQCFNCIDQAVQKLINEITSSLKSVLSYQYHASMVPQHIPALLQRQCNAYNQLKKNIYDDHLAKIKQFDKNFCGIIQQMLREKGVDQNTLFDNALRTQNMNQNIVNLLNICQTVPPASPNHIDKPIANELNQFLSIISEIIQNTPLNTNVASNSPFTVPNRDENILITETDAINVSLSNKIANRNHDNVFISENMMNVFVSQLYNNTNTNFSDNNNIRNEKNCVSNNHADSSQLKNLKEPVHSGNKAIPSQTNDIINNTNIMNNNVNSVPSQMSGIQLSMNGNNESKMNNDPSSGKQTIVSRTPTTPTTPPKPPPPHSNVSNSHDNDSDHGYECTFCNIMFDTAQEWKGHLRKAHFKTHSKKKKLNPSQHKKNKRKQKRSFNKMINDSNDHSYDIVNAFNKRRRQITYQCKQHDKQYDKQYSRPSSYSTHYNHRKENTNDLEMLKLFSLRGIKKNDR